MRAERWQQIEELYHSALEPERLAFVAEACASDEEVRREVESLLASHEQANEFIEEPVAEAAARLFVNDQTRSRVGQQAIEFIAALLLLLKGLRTLFLDHL